MSENEIVDVIVEPTLAAEEIDMIYKGCLASAQLLAGDKPSLMTDEQWEECIAENKEHIKLMLLQTFWTTEDLTPLHNAIEE